MNEKRTVRVALLGCGVVGSQVARLLHEQAGDLAARVGAPVELVGVAVRRLGIPRDVDLPEHLFTTDAEALVSRGDIDVVVEVIGGIEPARTLILSALEHGASVVSANKALLAEDGSTLFEAAEKAGRDLYYEAAVAGAIPILRPLRESLAGDQVTRVLGIVNGTTNFILDRMDSSGAGFNEALEEAQELGYAEADPTADVEGFDAAAKAAILASLAFHTRVTAADVHREGIAEVTASDVASAAEMGCVVKLLAICALENGPDGPAVSARVHPAMIPRSHPLASVREAYNAVFVESEAAGQLMFYGPGAGRRADRECGDGRPRHGRAQPARGRPRRGRVVVRRPAGAADGARPRPATTCRSTSTTRRACSRPSPRSSPSTTSPSRPCARRAAATTPSSSWSRTAPATPTSSATVAPPAGPRQRARGVLGDARGGRPGMTPE